MAKGIVNKEYDLNVGFRDTQNHIYAAQDSLLYWSRLGPYYLEGAVNPSPQCLNPKVGGSVTATYKDDHLATEPITNYLPEAIALGERTYPTFNINNNGDLTSGVRYAEFLPTNPAGTFDFTTLANAHGAQATDATDKPFSISIWFRPSWLPSTYASYRQIVGKMGGDGSVSSREAYMIRAQGDRVAFFLVDSSGVATNKMIHARTNSAYPPALTVGRWTHIVCTYNADPNVTGNDKKSLLTIYINGERAINQTTHSAAGTYNGMLPKYDEPLSVGHGSAHMGWHASGDVAELAVWDRALSAGEAAAVYNATKTSMVKYGSGYLSNPARVMLQAEDQIANTYPQHRSLGGMPVESTAWNDESSIFPYVENSTIDFTTPYAEASITFNDLPADARTVTLFGGVPGAAVAEFMPGIGFLSLLPNGSTGAPSYMSADWATTFPDWTTLPDSNTASARTELRSASATALTPLTGQILVFNGSAAGAAGIRALQYNGFIRPTNTSAGDILLTFLVSRGEWDDTGNRPNSLDMEKPDSIGSSTFEGLVVQYSLDGTDWKNVHALPIGSETVSALQGIEIDATQGGGTAADEARRTDIFDGDNHGLQRVKVQIRWPGAQYKVRIAQLTPTSGGSYDNWALKDVRMYRTASPKKFEFQRGIISEQDSVVVDLTNLSKEQRTRWINEQTEYASRVKLSKPLSKRAIFRKVRGMQAAAKFAEAVNQYTSTLKIKAIVSENTVKLQQMCPGLGGNTLIEKGRLEFKNADIPDAFTGGTRQKIVYPIALPYDTKYVEEVSQGTRLHTTASFLKSDPPLELTNLAAPSIIGPKPIHASGPIRKGVSDGNPTLGVSSDERVKVYTAFNDSTVPLPELEFYEEGLSEEVKEFFSSPLKDKAMIIIDLEPQQPTTWGFEHGEQSSGGSDFVGPHHLMVYYNFEAGVWEKIGSGFSQNINFYDVDNGFPGYMGVKGFLDRACIGFSRGVELMASGTQSQCRPISSFGFPFHPKFHATGSQALDLSRYINAPFSLEKYVYAYSGSWSPGASYDFLTNMAYLDEDKDGAVDTTAKGSPDYTVVKSQDHVRVDNGENHGFFMNSTTRNGTQLGKECWQSTYVDQVHRAAINSFFMLRQSPASYTYENKVQGVSVDAASGWGSGQLAEWTLTGSVPRLQQLGKTDVGSSKVVSTIRDLVTYGQWVTYAPAPSGAISPSGVPYAVMINDMSGVLADGLAREVNTLDYGYYTPYIQEGTGYSPFEVVGGIAQQPTAKGGANIATIDDSGGTSRAAGYFTHYAQGGVHKIQPSPTGSYIMRGKAKRPIKSSGSFAFQTGHDSLNEFMIYPAWNGARTGMPDRPADTRSLVNGIEGMRPIGTSPDMDFLNEYNPIRFSANDRKVNLFEYDDTSPYILMPEDKLVFGWQTTLPAKISRAADSGPSTNDPMGYNLHGREASGPNMTLSPGAGKLILFGSFIKEDKEFLPSSEQALVSNQIHQAIGNEPVVDQFDVEYVSQFAGSMFEEYVTGSMLQAESIGGASTAHPWPTPKARAISMTANGTPKTPALGTPWQNLNRSLTLADSGTFRRVVRHVDSGERYYDSLVGNPALYHMVSGLPIVKDMSLGGCNVDGGIILGMPGQTFTNFAVERDAIDTRWINAFPFEGYYAGVDRLSALEKFDEMIPSIGDSGAGDGWNTDPPPDRGLFPVQSLFFDPSDDGGNAFMVTDTNGNANLPGARKEILNFYFGNGDGPQGMPSWYYHDATTRKVIPIIRGFKYGVLNAHPQNTSAVYRRDSYGQFRDMMEQRGMTRFFHEANAEDSRRRSFLSRPAVTVLFVDPDTGDTTSAVNTHSQNLSPFATSSMPYFDGEVKNREDNPDVNADFTITM